MTSIQPDQAIMAAIERHWTIDALRHPSRSDDDGLEPFISKLVSTISH
jgi:hypothetical protein